MMRSPILILFPAVLFGFSSCGGETKGAQLEGEVGCVGDCEDEAPPSEKMVADVEKADPTGAYGKGVTLTEFTKISTILATPADFEGKRVLVKGEAVGVCSKKGCWVELKGDEPYQSLRVKVEDGEIVFPVSCKGHEIVAEGVVEKLEFPVEKHREILAARAETKGEEFDPESVTGPLVIWQLKGLGAKIES